MSDDERKAFASMSDDERKAFASMSEDERSALINLREAEAEIAAEAAHNQLMASAVAEVETRLGEALAAAEEKAATAAAEAAAASEAIDAMQAQFVALKMELEAARAAKVEGATVPPPAMAQPAQSRLASSEARDVGRLHTRLAATEAADAGGNGGSSGESRSGELKEAWAKVRALEEAVTLTREASSRQVSQAVAGQKVLQAVMLARYRKLQQKFASALEEARVAATAAA
jgi:hypothetical protein